MVLLLNTKTKKHIRNINIEINIKTLFSVHCSTGIWGKVTHCNKDVHSFRCFPKQQLPSVLDIKHSVHTRHMASFAQEFMSLPSFLYLPLSLIEQFFMFL